MIFKIPKNDVSVKVFIKNIYEKQKDRFSVDYSKCQFLMQNENKVEIDSSKKMRECFSELRNHKMYVFLQNTLNLNIGNKYFHIFIPSCKKYSIKKLL